jgi:adenylate cyclase
LMQIFSRFVSPELATFIWRRRAEFEGERRLRPEQMIATALFADLAGFVGMAAEKTPEALLVWMNEYMGPVTETLMRHGALIRQYAGDQIVVFFGVPVARKADAEIDRDAVSAVECALAIEATLRNLNRRWRAEGRTTMGVRIGIMTGPMIVGTLGNELRSELTVEGDTVNTASRLESYDKQFRAPDPESPKPARILIAASTFERLGDRFDTEPLGEIAVKGKAQQITAYRVIGLKSPLAEMFEQTPRMNGSTS